MSSEWVVIWCIPGFSTNVSGSIEGMRRATPSGSVDATGDATRDTNTDDRGGAISA